MKTHKKMKKKFKATMLFAYCMLAALLSVGSAYAQQTLRVSGKVTYESGEAAVGATIIIPKTTVGTVSGSDGSYTINLPAGETQLQFSGFGYESVTIDVGNRTVIDVVLTAQTTALEDVVLIGYGSVRKNQLTGAVSSVKGDDLITTSTSSVSGMLRGKATGLYVSQNSAKPGSNYTFRIRGQRNPLIIIDGVPQTSFSELNANTSYSGGATDSQMITLNPDDVESIDILKDAASTAIYGASASGGVILITTKRGKAAQKESLEVKYSGTVTVQQLSDFPKFLTAREFMEEQNKIFYELDNSVGLYSRHPQAKIDNFMGDGTRWIDEVTRTGVVNEHNLSINSGGEKTQYLVSASYYDHKGVARNNGMNRLTGRINLDRSFNKWLKGGVNTAYTRIKYDDVPLGDSRQGNSALIYSAMTFNPLVPVYNQYGEYSDNPDRNIYPNPVSLLEVKDQTTNHNLNANAHITIQPVKGLSVKGLLGIDYKSVQSNQYIPTTTKMGEARDGIATKNNGISQMILANVIANYNKTFCQRHTLGVMGGYEYRKNMWEGTYVTASDFPTDFPTWNYLQASQQEKPYLSSYKNSSEYLSFVARLHYAYADKYMLTANFRLDGSSNFAKNHQYATFPGISLAWRVAEEPFVKNNISWLNEFKLRASWGQVGNAGSLTGIETYYRINPNTYAFSNSMYNGASLAQLGNPDLKWQTATDINFGLDVGLFRNRLSATVEFYQRREIDIIIAKNLMTYNAVKTIDYNSGNVYRTRGIDLTVRSNNITQKNFTWTTDISFTYYSSYTVERDADFNPDIYLPYKEKWGNVYIYKSDGLVALGESVPFMPSAKPGAIKYRDIDGYVTDDKGNSVRGADGRYLYTGAPDGVLDAADIYIAGNSTPIPFGFNNTFRYRNLDLNIYIYGSLNGFKVNEVLEQSSLAITDMTYGLNGLREIKKRWSPDNPEGTLPGVEQGNSGVQSSRGDFFYEDAWYARLDNVSLGYTFPKKWVGKHLNTLRLWAGARNLYVLTPFGGMDPETGNGIGAYPNQRSYVMGINITF